MKKIILGILAIISFQGNAQKKKTLEWISSTEKTPWQSKTLSADKSSEKAIEIYTNKPLQKIDGFGACFNELGWTSLSELS